MPTETSADLFRESSGTRVNYRMALTTLLDLIAGGNHEAADLEHLALAYKALQEGGLPR